ncbi:FAD-dependent oxidoreductase [Parendozoicomonas haliclonae]|uniref:Glucosaminate ammonia-lyase n=1 Tax=Parendozoicomonas haliclonae TaxID=1960125 RepID=A0A1X7ALP2_9GAMM|nr:FAD-dependent oxidoreductase [Parendozoicomonas haliclonae]SMA48631.1 Glucosaminate ammonia-lyase [Parendozoicomonas haliclonae]
MMKAFFSKTYQTITRTFISSLLMMSAVAFAEPQIWDVAVIGDGPSGYSASIEATRSGLSVLHLTGNDIGGQISRTPTLDNWPGEPNHLSGAELIVRMKKHSLSTNRVKMSLYVDGIAKQGEYFALRTNMGVYFAHAVIAAPGASPNIPMQIMTRDNLPTGDNIHTCTLCDGFNYQNQPVAIIGGGNTAAEQALTMANIASQVFLLVRKDTLRAQQTYRQELEKNPRVTILYETQAVNITHRSHFLQNIQHNLRLKLNSSQPTDSHLDVDALFIATGQTPVTEFVDATLLDREGYLRNRQNPHQVTSSALLKIARRSPNPFDIVQASEGVKTFVQLQQNLLTRSNHNNTQDVIIIGDSAGAYSAALYAARDNYKVTLIPWPNNPSHSSVFWPDFGSINVQTLKARMRKQVTHAGVRVIDNDTQVVMSHLYGYWQVSTSEGTIISKTLIMDESASPSDDLQDVRSPEEGIFVAGDAVKGSVNQAITAAAAGKRAAMAASNWLLNNRPYR